MTVRPLPVVTAGLVAANLAGYAWERAAISAGGNPCGTFGLVPARFLSTGDVVPLFTCTFLHDPANLVHLTGNMLALLVFGVVVEPAVGRLPFGVLYASAAILGGLTHVMVDPSSTTPLVGCSGCVFALLAVAAVARPRALGFVAPYVAFNLLALVSSHSPFAMPGVAIGAHVGGFVCGALVVLLRRARDAVEMPRVAAA